MVRRSRAIVEPGPFRTDWAGRSLKTPQNAIADYAQSAGARRAAIQGYSGSQQGDPVRGAEAIIQAVEGADRTLSTFRYYFAQREAVESVKRGDDGILTVKTTVATYRARAVILATGLRGKPRLVAMFYTSCQYICPLIVDSGKAVERQLAPAERARIGIVLVSMDPARDTPKALQAVADKRKLDGGRWTLLAPQADDVRGIAAVLGVRYRQLADGQFNHSSALVLLDADGRVLARTEKMGTQPDPEFVAAVRRAAAAK